MYIFVEAERFGTEWYSTPRIASPRIFLAKCGVVRRFVHFNGSDFSRRDFDPSFLSSKRERERFSSPQTFQFMISFINPILFPRFKHSSNGITESKRNFSSKRKCFNYQADATFILEDSRLSFTNFPIL